MAPTEAAPESKDITTYAGFDRFALELDFVQLLSNPYYLYHLSTLSAPSPTPGTTPPSEKKVRSTQQTANPMSKLLLHTPFVAYLSYLTYWSNPKYIRYLEYPEMTLRVLELLQLDKFRTDLCKEGKGVEVVVALVEGALKGVARGMDGEKIGEKG